MFSLVDGSSSYNNIKMQPLDAEKIASWTQIVNSHDTLMSFSLRNADATYQQAMIAIS